MKLYTPRIVFGSDAAMDVADERDGPEASRVGADRLENSTYNVLQVGDVSQVMTEMAGRNQMIDDESESIQGWPGVDSSHAHGMQDSGDVALLDALFPETAVLYEQHGISSDDFSVDEAASVAEGDLDGIIDAVMSTEPAPGLETIVGDRDSDAENEQEMGEPEPSDDPADVFQM